MNQIKPPVQENRIDILNLEWTSYPSRDRQAASLVCNYLRYKGYNVVEGSIFNGFELIDKHAPRLLFITNTTGAKINYQTMKHAIQRNILGVSLISEGNIKPWNKNIISQFFWGWNKEKILYENLNLQWSNRAKKLIHSIHPELDNRIKVSGGVGFDYYKIIPQGNKGAFLHKYGKSQYQKVIGIGCFDFGPMYPKDSRYALQQKLFTKEQVDRFKSDRQQFNNVLIGLIKNNPEILFLIKEHPGNQLGHFSSAIEGADAFDNTLILKTEESIFDCINVSDFWIIYESTTALEAWLMNKQTMLLNPSGVDFKRDELYKGSPNFTAEQEVQQGINQFYTDQNIVGFKELTDARNQLIEDTIGWDDGLNHVRAGNYIIDVLNNNPRLELKHTLETYIERKVQNVLWVSSKHLKRLPYFRYYNQKKNQHSQQELDKYSDRLYKYQNLFYTKGKIRQ